MGSQASPEAIGPTASKALVLIPGTINYFYNTTGRRVSEALTGLGLRVAIRTLAEAEADARRGEEPADLCMVMNVGEVLLGGGDRDAGIRRLRALGPFRLLANVGLDSVRTHWFGDLSSWCERAGVGTILDLGLVDQSDWVPPGIGVSYRFVPDGLTASEFRALEAAAGRGDDRPIPWSFVGHVTADRAGFVDHLVNAVDPSGFVYMPPLEPYTEAGSPHLNHDQFLAVLGKSRYHIWCSHHPYFYMEPERFRLSVLSGCVPIKALIDGQEPPDDAPLRPMMVPQEELSEALRPGRDAWYRRLATDAYRRRSLSAAFAGALADLGIRCPSARTPADRPWPLSA
ncbi:hypothetical protein [Tautonia plasticadhaerens]|uniref:Polysaccharide pyruvyl transferase n=1 Tax=Tautonia plasticadhaerens TaxID=2527974 RepID=A0A518HFI7_9BACT|nr:hypothetical protein [Tautonia plasticadhaerens]QDV39609.1 hypothetical protein ElP_75800 [Tautonia plasticadhaerens]